MTASSLDVATQRRLPNVAAAAVSSTRTRAIAGTLAVSLAIGGGRWGAYLGHSPIYLTDMLVVGALARFLWLRERQRDQGLMSRARGTAPLLALGTWAVARFFLGGRLSIVALRDFEPYACAFLGVIAGAALIGSTAAQRARTGRILVRVLGFHAAWVFVAVVLHPSFFGHMPTLSAAQGVKLFTVRQDFDMSMVGVFAAYLLWKALRTGWSWPLLLGIGACWAPILSAHSRGGVVGAVIANAFVLWALVRHIAIPYRARMAAVGLAVIVVGAFVLAIPSFLGGQRLLSGFGLGTYTGKAAAVGTTHARENAWKAVIDYSAATPARFVAGVGFGPDFMVDSGALLKLVGTNTASDTEPRSPHTWWLGTLARLGLIGLVMAVAMLVALGKRISQLASDRARFEEPLTQISILVVLALLVPLSVGVILESPFGAVPFFWCAGVILARRPPESTEA